MIGAVTSAPVLPAGRRQPAPELPLDRFEASPPALVELRPFLAPRPLDSVEFKLMLDPSHVSSFYDKLESVATGLGMEVKRTDDGDSKRRTIEYLDTPDFALKERGYILRSRTRVKSKPVLALKFRDADRIKAAGANVAAAEGLESEGKFEKDVTPSKQLFASSNKVKLKKLPDPTLKEFAEVFPGLGELGLPGGSRLQPVRGRHIEEEVHDLAEIDLGSGVKSLAQVTVWYEHDEPVIAELSFDLTPASEARGQKLLNALKSEGGAWLGSGTTKTEYVYSA